MAKSIERQQARKLRKHGASIRTIAKTLEVSRASVSSWCRDIVLSSIQIEHLRGQQIRGGFSGRMMGAAANRMKRLKRIELYQEEGAKKLISVTNGELLLLGLGLYLGEGSKTKNRAEFTNSNVEIIKLYLHWLYVCFDVQPSEILCRVLINTIHKARVVTIEKIWAETIGIPIKQFSPTTLIKTRNKKEYENADEYIGVLKVTVRKSSELQYKILGLIYGLMYNIIRRPA